jgi:hypothetical protein
MQRLTLRFFNNDTWFVDAEVLTLLTALRNSSPKARVGWFEEVLRFRRRFKVRWQETSLAPVLLKEDERELLRARELVSQVTQALSQRGLGLEEVFNRLDVDGSRFLTPLEIQSGLMALELGLLPAQIEELVAFMDDSLDGCIDFTEFAKVFSGLH